MNVLRTLQAPKGDREVSKQMLSGVSTDFDGVPSFVEMQGHKDINEIK